MITACRISKIKCSVSEDTSNVFIPSQNELIPLSHAYLEIKRDKDGIVLANVSLYQADDEFNHPSTCKDLSHNM